MQQSFRPAVRLVILNKKNQILLVKHKNYWAIPGGGVDYGESLEETLTRESKEELNIEGKLDAVIFLQDFIVDKPNSPHCIEYFCTIKNNHDFENVCDTWKAASHAFELEEIKWFDISEFPDKFMPIAFPQVIKEYINDSNTITKYISTL